MIKCLIELKWFEEATDFISVFREKFPKHADVQALKTLEKRFDDVKLEVKEAEAKRRSHLDFAFQPINDGGGSGDEEELPEAEQRRRRRNGSDTAAAAEERTPNPLEDVLNDLKSEAVDFKLRFCGHCNTTTDIKEANFFGRYVCAYNTLFVFSQA